MFASRFGSQPLLAQLRAQRWSKPLAAQALGLPLNHLICVGRGSTAPSRVVVEGLCRLLDAPPEALFTRAALSAVRDYVPKTTSRVHR